MQFTITIPTPVRILRQWRWTLLAALVLVITLAGGNGSAHAAFPGLNGKIAFQTTRDGNAEIYVMNGDGTGQTNLSNNAATDQYPVWSPDGTKIVFDSTRDGNYEVYVMNADGTGQTRLTTNSAVDETPAWSPDGTKIAFASSRDGNNEIYVMNADGSGQTRLTNNTADDHFPIWSPNGSKIAFASNRDGNFEVYVMNADGSGQIDLTNNAAFDYAPDWSPDGTKIAFQSDRDGNVEVYVMNADGTGQTRLTVNVANDAAPGWSPDGTKIAFGTNRDGGPDQIYAMTANGSSPARLTNDAGSDGNPDWQPQSLALNIRSVGQYALPKTCFEVRNSSEVALFTICDNDYAGPPASNVLCIPDGICNDENPLAGSVSLSLTAGAYRVAETSSAPQHTKDVPSKACSTTCAVTFASFPTTRPWFPWDIVGGPNLTPDGRVTVADILSVVSHYGQQKPLP